MCSPFEKGVWGIEYASMSKLKYNKEHREFSRELRNNSTKIILWSKVLRAKKMHGYQFNRQFPIDKYIVDFICRKLNLIIEIDGYSHNFKQESDINRDTFLSTLGYITLRFTEKQVRYDLDNVAKTIEDKIIELEALQNKKD
jgi:very-short-patch-repair endonuclease